MLFLYIVSCPRSPAVKGLYGGSGHHAPYSGSGDDFVEGGAGGDLLNSGAGEDRIDRLAGESAATYDKIYCGGGGADFVEASLYDYVTPYRETVRRY